MSFGNRCEGRLIFFICYKDLKTSWAHKCTECPVLRDHDAARTWHEDVPRVDLAGCWELKTQEARLPSWSISQAQGMNALSIFFFMKPSQTVVSAGPVCVN